MDNTEKTLFLISGKSKSFIYIIMVILLLSDSEGLYVDLRYIVIRVLCFMFYGCIIPCESFKETKIHL